MKKPNILFVFADQLRYDSLACNGNRIVQTPNIDRLGREGIVYDHALSSCPICSPYRGQILTGMFSHANGVICNEYRVRPEVPTIANVLREEGYRTAYVGKLHLGYGPYDTDEKRLGFDDMIAYNNGHRYYEGSYHRNDEGPFPIREWAPRGETQLLLDWLDEAKDQDAPFCAFLSWGPPHWTGVRGEEGEYADYPQEYALYDREDMPVPNNVPSMLRHYEQQEIADYYGMITGLDDCMGRILDYLDANGLSENTIICFSSDHGDHLGAHGYAKPAVKWLPPELRASKATCYEESIHIPLLMRFPQRIGKHQRTDVLFNSTDVMPTLLGLCDVPVPDGVQGTDLSHVALGEEGDTPDSAYLQILGPGWPTRYDFTGLWRGVRTQQYTYARFAYPEKKRQLFDRHADPLEQHNLADDPAHAETAAMMEQYLQEWMDKTNDPFDTGQRLPDTGMLNLGQELTTTWHYNNMPPRYSAALQKLNGRG